MFRATRYRGQCLHFGPQLLCFFWFFSVMFLHYGKFFLEEIIENLSTNMTDDDHFFDWQLNEDDLISEIRNFFLGIVEYTLSFEKCMDQPDCLLALRNCNRQMCKWKRISIPKGESYEFIPSLPFQIIFKSSTNSTIHYFFQPLARNLRLIHFELFMNDFDGDVPQSDLQPPLYFLLMPFEIGIVIKNLLAAHSIQLPLDRLELQLLYPLLLELIAS